MIDCCICLLGGDERMKKLGELFYSAGYEINTDCDMAENGDILIMPPNVFALPDCYKKFKKIFGGNVKNLPEDTSFYNYAENEYFTQENAYLTARGLIEIIKNDGIALEKKKVLVTGFGFCGKAIADELKKSGAELSVMVRKRELKRSIREKGFLYVDMNETDEVTLSGYDILINTVPALVVDKSMLDKLSDSVKIYDIASSPGGVDFLYCRERNIKAALYLGIPGKMCPDAAAKVIYDTIINDIN